MDTRQCDGNVKLWLVCLHVFLICICTSSTFANAGETPPLPEGEVLLTITGKVSTPNVDDEIHLDANWLKSLPVTTFSTHTPWSDGVHEFSGFRLSDLFDAIGTDSKRFVAIGLDNYQYTIENIDFVQYPIIIAYMQNGEEISRRKLGPLRIMIPFDDYPELLNDSNTASAVWQLVTIELL